MNMMDRASSEKSGAELLHQESYTPEELDRLLGVGLDVIRRGVHTGSLRAEVVGNDIVRIHRADALDWLARRETEEEPPAEVEHVP